MSDTPRTDEQINGKPGTRFAILVGDSLRDALVASEFARQLERELNAAHEHIKRLEEAGDDLATHALAGGVPQLFMEFVENWHKAKEAKP